MLTQSKDTQLSIVIVSYNVKHYLAQCLDSIARAIGSLRVEVFVVDNHSHDHTVDYIAQHFPWVKIIASDKNLGFAKANNKAIKESTAPYILLLNPDTIVGEDVLTNALDYMENHPQVGSCGVRMLRVDGQPAPESRRGEPTPATSAYKMLGLCRLMPHHHHFGRYYMGWLHWDEPAEIDVVSGAFCLLRRKAIDEVGSLDDTFFMYGEDTDLSHRIRNGGWKNTYLPLNILHYKGESTQKQSYHYVYTFHNALLIFIRKHYLKKALLLYPPLVLAVCLRALWGFTSVSVQKGIALLPKALQRKEKTKVYLYKGGEGFKEEFEQWAMNKGISTSVEGQQNAIEVYDVYVPQDTTYTEILKNLRHQEGKRHKLAVYNPQNKTLITDKQILF